MNDLAFLLIDSERNLPEGVKLVEKALESNPDDYRYLDCKGWGLYKQKKYREALELLERSWKLKPVYKHEIFLHLEAAKKAVAAQK
jgi:tetratricopeptide (TPR) repeat protein